MNDLKNKADNFRKNKEWDKAKEIYENLWNQNQDKWIGWGLAFCCSRLGDHKKALEISKIVYDDNQTFNFIKKVYAWSAYSEKIRNFRNNDNYSELKSYCLRIIQITDNIEENKDDLSKILTILKMMDFCESNSLWNELIEWANKINYENLSKERKISERGNRYSSQLEKYIKYISKAYENLESWIECKKILQIGLEYYPDNFSYKYRLAKITGLSGDYKTAIKRLKECIKIKKDWYLYKDIGIFYDKLKDKDNAEKSFIQSCITVQETPNIEYAINLFHIISLFYLDTNKDLAKYHYLASIGLARDHHWRIKENITNRAKSLDVDINDSIDTNVILKKLKIEWKNIINKYLTYEHGHIKTILPNNKAGFITSENNIDYYFKKNSFNLNDRKKIKAESKVKFTLEKSFDKKKNKDSLSAINCSLIQE